jgi:hypothetical protein
LIAYKYIFRLIGILWIGLHAVPSTAQAPTHQDFSCSLGPIKRIVSIITLPPSDRLPRGACRVDYIKDGTTRTLWSSSTGHAYCIKQATAFVTKLAEAHYSCSLQTVDGLDRPPKPEAQLK